MSNPTHDEILSWVRTTMAERGVHPGEVARACGRSTNGIREILNPRYQLNRELTGKRPSLDVMLGFFEVLGVRVILPDEGLPSQP